MPGVDDAPVLDLDERAQLVGFAEAIAGAERLEIVDPIGRWLVVCVTPNSNGIFAGPVIASDGIQEIAMTDDSKRCRTNGPLLRTRSTV